jgi:Rho termination factor, N-terminal domain
MAAKTEFQEFLAALGKFITDYAAGDNGTGGKSSGDDEGTQRSSENTARRQELEKMHLAKLKKLVRDLGYPKEDVDEADRETLVGTVLEEEAEGGNDEEPESEAEEPDEEEDEGEEEDEDEGDEEEEDGEEESDTYSREELEQMSLSEIKKVAKESGYAASDLKGQDQDAIVDLLLGESDDEDEDEAEDEEEEEEEESYSEADLKKMNLRELKSLAEEYEIDPTGMKKPEVIAALMEE